MKVIFGADDRNECTQAVVDYLRGECDLGIAGGGKWPEFAREVGHAVARGDADFGVVMCWTGTGTSIAANKVEGARAALAWEPWIARNARLWNDANVLALSLKRLAPDVAVECVRAFLAVGAEDPDETGNIDMIRGRLAGISRVRPGSGMPAARARSRGRFRARYAGGGAGAAQRPGASPARWGRGPEPS